MSHTLDKRYGDLFIFGEYPDGKVDLNWSNNTDEFEIPNIPRERAERMMQVWDDQREEMYRLYDKAQKYESLQE